MPITWIRRVLVPWSSSKASNFAVKGAHPNQTPPGCQLVPQLVVAKPERLNGAVGRFLRSELWGQAVEVPRVRRSIMPLGKAPALNLATRQSNGLKYGQATCAADRDAIGKPHGAASLFNN